MVSPSISDIPDALQRLGLTPLEGDIYRFLVQESPATGYRIAQALGRPVGNIYKAVESLETKGAILVSDDEGNRVARAVSITEFANRVRAEISQACTIAGRELAATDEVTTDDRLYRLTDRLQVFERARRMIESAGSFVVVNVTPALAGELKADFQAAAARGVRIGIKTFVSIAIEGCEVTVDPRGTKAVDSGPGQWLALTPDGRELLDALFDSSGHGLHTATWTANPMLVWMGFTGMASDLALAQVKNDLNAGMDAAEVRRRLRARAAYESPSRSGRTTLIQRYRQPSRPRADSAES